MGEKIRRMIISVGRRLDSEVVFFIIHNYVPSIHKQEEEKGRIERDNQPPTQPAR